MTNFQLTRATVPLLDHYAELRGWCAFEAKWDRPVDFAALDDHIEAIEAWCVDQFGGSGERFVMIGLIYLFRDEADAAAFRIRWG